MPMDKNHKGPKPEMLGTGGAAKAGKAMMSRKERLQMMEEMAVNHPQKVSSVKTTDKKSKN